MSNESKYPNCVESGSDKELIAEFYHDLLQKYPGLTDEIKMNEGLLYLDMGALQGFAEALCKERKLNELKECFDWLDSLFCRSKNELLNAINVSFLEYFDFSAGLSQNEFKKLMPQTLYRGYREMIEYMDNLATEYNNKLKGQKEPNE